MVLLWCCVVLLCCGVVLWCCGVVVVLWGCVVVWWGVVVKKPYFIFRDFPFISHPVTYRYDLVVINPGFVMGPPLSPTQSGESVDFLLNMMNGKYDSQNTNT